jgi:hypothetical protein
MKFFSILWGYAKWHYTKAFVSTTLICRNILVFLFNYFSIKTLLREFFSPWKRNAGEYKKKFDLKAFFEILIVNTMMRIFGIIVRSVMLVIGVATCLIFIVLYPLIIILWIILPLFVIYLLALGIILIFA